MTPASRSSFGVAVLICLLIISGCSRSGSESARPQQVSQESKPKPEFDTTSEPEPPSDESDSAKSPKPEPKKKTKRKPIYDETADAKADIQAALRRAAVRHKRVLVKFGGNWCGWCYKLHDMFHNDPVIAPIVEANYELVLVDSDSNRNLMEKLNPGRQFGYPWLAVLDADGALLTTQQTGVLETGDHHDVEKVKAFLLKWKAEDKPRKSP